MANNAERESGSSDEDYEDVEDEDMDMEQIPGGYPEGMEEEMQSQTEEHLWIETLSDENKTIKFEGCDDAESSLILRRATINAECEDEGRQVVQIISLDHNDKRIIGTLCSLNVNGNCSVSLDGISCSPPTAFRLVKGKGPVTLVANLIKEVDPSLLPDNESEDEEDEAMEFNEAGEEENNEPTALKRKTDTSSEEEASEEEADKPQPKKAKVEPKKQPAKPAAKAESKPQPKTENKENTKPATNGTAKEEPKKKQERPKPTNVEELIAAVKAHRGGTPKKQEKFKKWVKAIFKIDNEKWIEQTWESVKAAKA